MVGKWLARSAAPRCMQENSFVPLGKRIWLVLGREYALTPLTPQTVMSPAPQVIYQDGTMRLVH